MSHGKKKKGPRATDGGCEWMMRSKIARPGGTHNRRKPARGPVKANAIREHS